VPYTLADLDRAILTEAKVNSIYAKIEIRFESVDKQFISQQKLIDDLKTLFYGGFSILISLFLFMFGYMIWDRRTAMKPAADILRTHGML
jgi:deferrochelatase/peroxidase EfeB